jgi:ABC-type lipoprotein export system ATPase subunit
MSEVVIELEKVSKTYGSGAAATRAVADVSMAVERGSWVAIMGPSGHGKSTLLQLMGGLDRPSTGRILLHGAELLGVLDGLHQAGKTLLMVTHNPAVAARAGRIVQVKDGRIVADTGNGTA